MQVERAVIAPGNRKGCDIGYVPAICSCEKAHSVDTCTVAALDAIAAFASRPPASPRRVSRFFRVWLPVKVAPTSRSLSLLRIGKLWFRQSFQPSTPIKLNSRLSDVNAILGLKTKYL